MENPTTILLLLFVTNKNKQIIYVILYKPNIITINDV